MQDLKYLAGYPEHLKQQVRGLLAEDKLASVLLKKYAAAHDVRTDKALYQYVLDLKSAFLRNAEPISKVGFDNKIQVLKHALGTHTFISRVQGGKLKAKHEIRVASVFRSVPIEFLRMIVVHELAHLKEKEHDKAFYKLCQHMEPQYHQFEFDLRLYLTHMDLAGGALWGAQVEAA
ncbi:YgjP-like metallopeptidase domain-containing protein [Janthinobacterium sp. 17J80-10]|uniref:YgjP-like metallopeptidase domain-containing protein n=1 Tax=Janthinobacterium sp. 17J80-10 TaxID=2497863 RepID=UPI0010054085|nr:YgjP-like metallopeptidase domain-containing protein [Janthinobacterium sp. 17J80-10]QAU32790.1 M48 family peptidase [Janthinobacterium sp. 17J80-10]